MLEQLLLNLLVLVLPSALQHHGFLLVLWDPLQELLPQTDSCCLPVVLAPGKLPGICWGLVHFFSYDLHKQEMICLLVSLFALFVSLFIHCFLLQAEFTFRL